MPDIEDDFTKAFEGFGDDKPTEPVDVPKVDEPAEEPKKDEPKSDEPADSEAVAPALEEEKKPDEIAKDEPVAEEPKPSEEPKPLTKDDVASIITDLKQEERTSGKELDTVTKEVLDAYYPDGLSDVLVDEKTGKELLSPADVVEASGGTMSTEAATQWLMNEQFKLNQSLAKIKDDARNIAETTVNFKRDSVTAVEKYGPLFKQYPDLQKKVWTKLMTLVKVDNEKGVILSSPDVLEHYDFYLEPYQQAFEYATKQSATAPVTQPVTEPVAEPPKPSAEDRMDFDGDGGTTAPDDPNDFAQQVSKELAKGI